MHTTSRTEDIDYGEVFGYRFCIEHIMTYREVGLQIVALVAVAVSPMPIEIGRL